MSVKTIKDSTAIAIANAIREKTGKTETMSTADMASGVNEVYGKGKQAGWDEFWDMFQANGQRRCYSYAFAEPVGALVNYLSTWSKGFTPKYPIEYDSLSSTFAYFNKANSTPIDMVNFLNDNNIIFTPYNDLTFGISINGIFQMANVSRTPPIQFGMSSIQNAFYYCTNLVTIETLTIFKPSSTVNCNNSFYYCSKLQNITFEGQFCPTKLNFQWSPLTIESLRSLIDALEDKSAATSKTYKVTVGPDNLAKLTETDLQNIQVKGWQFV